MPRFTILLHTLPDDSHYDLLLEWPGQPKLRTWSLPAIPAPGESIEATALPDHRLIYLDYEGHIAGDRGEVTQWTTGEFTIESESADELVLTLNSKRLQGEALLQRTSGDHWQLTRRAGQA